MQYNIWQGIAYICSKWTISVYTISAKCIGYTLHTAYCTGDVLTSLYAWMVRASRYKTLSLYVYYTRDANAQWMTRKSCATWRNYSIIQLRRYRERDILFQYLFGEVFTLIIINAMLQYNTRAWNLCTNLLYKIFLTFVPNNRISQKQFFFW